MNKFLSTVSIIASLTLASAVQAEVKTFTIDPNHSQVGFKVRHFFNQIPGSFTKFSGQILVDTNDMTQTKATATIQPASISTGNEDRDSHLQEDDYFDVTKFATITYESTKWEQTGKDTYKVTGNLTMLGTTKPVVLDVTYLGQQEGTGKYYADKLINGFSAKGKLDRSDWGLDSGGPVVGDEVEIELSIQGHASLHEPGPKK